MSLHGWRLSTLAGIKGTVRLQTVPHARVPLKTQKLKLPLCLEMRIQNCCQSQTAAPLKSDCGYGSGIMIACCASAYTARASKLNFRLCVFMCWDLLFYYVCVWIFYFYVWIFYFIRIFFFYVFGSFILLCMCLDLLFYYVCVWIFFFMCLHLLFLCLWVS